MDWNSEEIQQRITTIKELVKDSRFSRMSEALEQKFYLVKDLVEKQDEFLKELSDFEDIWKEKPES
jgi:uncharacterized protein YozE (UPF0346 family)